MLWKYGLLSLALLTSGSALSHPDESGSAKHEARPWWSNALFYEIYPRSFGDFNGDGIGDLNGITAHLDDVVKLGADAIWITPIYPSPQVDFGYDIADYTAVDPQYGTLADLDGLIAAAKRRHLRILLDMVMNHTSDQHAWFKESASSRTNPKADWYLWNDGLPASTPGLSRQQRVNEHEGRVPPNNWISSFGGSAWEWVPARRQYYFHHFYKQQPDLNWREPAVEKAMFAAMRYWLDRGVDGFRLDVITTTYEDAALRNAPENGRVNAQGDPEQDIVYIDNLPEAHAMVARLRAMVDRYPGDHVLVGETYLPNIGALAEWYRGIPGPQLHLPMDMFPGFSGGRYTATHFRRTIEDAETKLPGSPLFAYDNHDNVRSIDRYGDGIHDIAIAKGLAAILLMPRGAALTYYGAPLGMRTSTPTRKEDVRDPIGITGWPEEKGRDGERTPMQWTPGPQAGFSASPNTWLPVAANYKTINVETQRKDRHSLLNWWQALVRLRKAEPALRNGDMKMLDKNNPDVLSFRRGGDRPGSVTVAVNMSAREASVDLGHSRFSTLAETDAVARPQDLSGRLKLAPYATWIGRSR